MPWASPLGQEATLLVAVHEPFLHLYIHFGIDEVQEREETTESVPETGIGEIAARQHFARMGAVVNRLAVDVVFEESTREEHGAVETGVECAEVVDVVVLNLDASENLIPAVAACLTDLVEGTVAQFFQVLPRLFLADERGGDAERYLLVLLRVKANHGYRVIAFRLVAEKCLAVQLLAPVLKLCVTLNDKIVAKIIGHTTAVA